MLKLYKIINSCLSVLKTADIQTVDKLKLEIQLINTKRLLLNRNIDGKIANVASNEHEFTLLHEHFNKLVQQIRTR